MVIAMNISDKELAILYVKYKKQKKHFKQNQKERGSLIDLNNYLEIKKRLSILKIEMNNRGITKKQAKKISKC